MATVTKVAATVLEAKKMMRAAKELGALRVVVEALGTWKDPKGELCFFHAGHDIVELGGSSVVVDVVNEDGLKERCRVKPAHSADLRLTIHF